MPASISADEQTDRIAGTDRYETAANMAQEVFQSASSVIIARGDQDNDFPDGLSASWLAGMLQSPILLTDKEIVPPVVLEAIQKLGATKLYILGGLMKI